MKYFQNPISRNTNNRSFHRFYTPLSFRLILIYLYMYMYIFENPSRPSNKRRFEGSAVSGAKNHRNPATITRARIPRDIRLGAQRVPVPIASRDQRNKYSSVWWVPRAFSSFKGESLPFFFEKGKGRGDSRGRETGERFLLSGWLFEGVWVGKIVLTTHKRLFVNAARRVWGRPRILINGTKEGRVA